MNLLKVLLNHLLSPAEPLQDVILRSVTLKTNPLRILSSLTTAPQCIQSTLIGMCFDPSHLPSNLFQCLADFLQGLCAMTIQGVVWEPEGVYLGSSTKEGYELNPRRGSWIITLRQGARYQHLELLC